jgi:hypothetical protein
LPSREIAKSVYNSAHRRDRHGGTLLPSEGGPPLPLALGIADQGPDWETGVTKTLPWCVVGILSDTTVAGGCTGSPTISGCIVLT